MTREEIIEIAKKCGWDNPATNMMPLYEFAKLVAKHTLMNIDPSKFISCQEVMEAARLAEREACAKVCEEYASANTSWTKAAVKDCAAIIRARGEQA